MPKDLSTGAVKQERRVAKARKRAAKASAKVASIAARQAKLDVTKTKAENAEDAAETDLALAESGLKRQFLTGRVVPVRGSRDGRNRAHSRAPPEGATR